MKGCDCISEPPVFDLPPPPDPSLVWHLLSTEKFEAVDECETNKYVSISDIGTIFDGTSEEDRQQIVINILIGVATFSVLLLIAICIAVIGRIRRRRLEKNESSKKMSTDSILVAGEHLWTYNSMKPSSVLMYSNNSNNGSRLFHHTPTTLRSYIGNGTPIIAPNIPIRHSESTTLRLNPNDTCSAYHTISVRQPSNEVYEEISPIGTIGYMTTNRQQINPNSGRMSIRRPPPKCRPPQPPQSPAISDGSFDKEITRITTVDSDSPRQWDDGIDGGRESGYGTAPSLQWKSPSGSARLDTYVPAPAPNPHTMTYV